MPYFQSNSLKIYSKYTKITFGIPARILPNIAYDDSFDLKPLLTREGLKSISSPTWVCLGDQDDMADRQYSEEVAGFLPNGKFLLLENTPHPVEKVSIDKLVDIATQVFH